MSNEENKNNNNFKKKYENDDNNTILEKNSEESDNDESKDSIDNNEPDQKLEAERQNYLNNPESFRRKRDFFSFYSKKRNSEIIPQKTVFNRRTNRLASHVIAQKPEFKRFSKFELKPRGFGVNKIKERIEFFEKKNLEEKYKTLNLTHYQKTYYDNNELRKFDNNLFKIENIQSISVSNNKISERKKSYNISEQDVSNDTNNKNNKVSPKKIGYNIFEKNLSNDTENKNKKYISEQNFSSVSDNKNIKDSQNKINYNISEQHFSFDSNNKKKEEKKQSDNKLNLNLIVDYSKILKSSKITKKEKELDLFMSKNVDNEKKSNKNNEEIDNSDDSDDSSCSSKGEVSTNLSHGLDKPLFLHNRQKSDLCYYKDIINKISTPESNFLSNNKDDSNIYQSKGSSKNNKYILVNKNDNKISLEKQTKFKNGIKKVLYENISDNMTLQKLDNAKFKLNQANNNKNNKRQIFDMLELIVLDNNNKSTIDSKKINNLYDRKKLIRAFEILPQLSIINQKIKAYLQNINNSTDINKEKFNEKEIKHTVSSIYLLECIGLEPIILFNGKAKIGKVKFINDLDGDIQLSGINNKKKYIKNYFQNLYKANFFLEILISNISKLQDTINISK